MPKTTVYKPQDKITKIFTGGTLEPPKFIPSFYEWLKEHGEDIVKWTDANVTLYAVPKDYTFFLCTAYVSCVNNAAGGTNTTSLVRFEAGITNGCQLIAAQVGIADENAINSISFPYPIKIRAGQLIRQYSSGNPHISNSGITGFLIKNSDIPQL